MIYLNTETEHGWGFLKTNKGLDMSLRLSLFSFYACIKKKGQNSCHECLIPPYLSRTSGKSGNLLWALQVCSTHLIHWHTSVTGFRDREEPVISHTYILQPCAAGSEQRQCLGTSTAREQLPVVHGRTWSRNPAQFHLCASRDLLLAQEPCYM